jgi:hypothetical protein
MSALYGSNRPFGWTARIFLTELITRSFSSLSQAVQENADSRVYAGIHFRSDCRHGIALLGEQIGRRAFAQCLQAYRT